MPHICWSIFKKSWAVQARNEGWLTLFYYHFLAGWWFGTFFMFPYIGNNHPNWQTHIFQRGWNHQPARFSTFSLMGPVIPDWQTCSSCKQNWPIGSTVETKLGMRALQTKCPYRTEREKPKNGAGNQQNGDPTKPGICHKIYCDTMRYHHPATIQKWV